MFKEKERHREQERDDTFRTIINNIDIINLIIFNVHKKRKCN
jgi:hypothetical protein